MAITNNPIALDSTAQAILTEMDRENALLSAYVEGQRRAVYSDISAFANVVRGNSVAQNRKLFPEGDQIIVPWKDMDDANHNTDETAYQVPMNIVHHGLVELQSGVQVPGVFLQWHHCTPYGVQFSHQQAFLKCVEGLAAGQYYITFGYTWGSQGAVSGSSWNFTLTQAVPAGGLLSGFETMADSASSAWKVKSWASPSAVTPIETVDVASGDEGTSLGTMNQIALSDDGLNGMQRVGYGHNRWDTSAVRKYLNGSGTNWWTPTEDFEVRPDQYSKHGFIDGFGEDFLEEIKPIKIVTALNTVEGYADASVITHDKFFLPSLEQMFINPQLAGVEGDSWKYWQRRLGRATKAAQYSTYPNLITTGIDNKASAQTVRLRSANRGHSYIAWGVYSSGHVYADSAYYAIRFSPVCVIC